jgi:hypothetical protein
MYSTTAYLYQQIQTVILVDVTGAYFDRRWQQVYAKELKLNLGVDNVILFQFQNQDQKPVNISGATFTFRTISQNGEDLLIAKELVSLSNSLGRAKVTITAEETTYFQAQPANWSIEISSGVLNQAVLTDDYSNARGVIEIVNSVFPAFVDSQLLTIPDQSPQGNVYYTSTITTNGSSLTTFQMDTVNYTGNLSVQGATDATSNTVEWYDIEFLDLDTGNTVDQLDFTNSYKKLGINVQGYHPNLRLSFTTNNGAVEDILYR